jgi:dipeptidyl aminopeptidase/acylaminoacyl peptidase
MPHRRFLQHRTGLALLLIAMLDGGMVAQTAPVPGRSARAVDALQLTVESIMRGPDLVGYPPTGLRWSGDSKRLYFEWRRPGEDEATTWMVGTEGSGPTQLSDDARKLAPPAAGGQWDKARRRVVFVDRGDIVLLDSVADRRTQITRTTDTEANPRWARDETHVTFTRGGNLFIVPVQASSGGTPGMLTQLTDVASKKPDPRLTDSQKYLRQEEKKLIEHIREQAEKKEKDEKKQKRDALPEFELRDGQTAVDLAFSPDDQHVFIVVSERGQGSKGSDVPNYVTESSYSELIPGRLKVGDVQEKRMLAILNIGTGKSVWADAAFAGPRPADTTSEPSSAAPSPSGPSQERQSSQAQEATSDRPVEKPKDSGRQVRWSMPSFSPDGKYAVVSVRATDNKDRWIVAVDPETGRVRVLEHTHDPAWIREGGGFGFSAPSTPFLDDGRRVYFLSERDGWMHLFTLDVSAATPRRRQLTEGKFEIDEARISTDGRTFYITSTEQHPGERHLYSVPVEGGARTRITRMMGSNEAEVSPDGSMLGIVYSSSTKPPEVLLMPNRAGAEAKQITTTPLAEWRAFKWIEPQLITFAARDGAQVPARLYRPEMIGARPDPARPGVVFVHGAGYLQNAHRYWSTYYREYMFHNLLASRGYVVLDVDYRGSAGYGRDWRTAIYRHMGGKDLEDIVDGAKYLASRQGVDARRIGVYGGSYGGFITLMAMFTTPDVFAAGAALRPVTDWAHYSHGYTSSILNIPQEDAEAYRRSSPIYFAEGLKGALLIAHGMVDTNVFFQDSVRLAQRLIELGKENWELAPYPVENHAFTEATSWSDEYKRILKLFENNLRRR